MVTKMLKLMLNSKSGELLFKRWNNTENRIITYDPFVSRPKKNKKTYLEAVKFFEKNDIRRRGHVEFIYAALARMKEFGVQKDLESYKALVDVLPKGKFIPQNIFQAEFQHYPKQQQCAVDLLEQMEDNGVMPDIEMEHMLLNIFGRRGIPLRKYWRMMYWMPKFRNLSPWYLPQKLPDSTMELAKLAIQRITSVDCNTQIDVWETDEIEASLDKTWIINGQSPSQRILLAEQAIEEPVVIKGPFEVYIRDQPVTYFTLIGKTRPDVMDNTDIDDVSKIGKTTGIPGFVENKALTTVVRTVHEQDDGTILAICATGTSSRDSLLSWIRLLEKYGNPILANIPVIFTLTAPISEISLTETEPTTKEKEKLSTS